MKNPSMPTSLKKILKVNAIILAGILLLLLTSFVIAVIYQSTSGNGSLFDVSRSISLPEGADNAFLEQITISSLSHQDVQSKYSELTNDDQWKEYALSILGTYVNWSGKVSSIESRRVEIDMGTAPLRYVILADLSDEEKAHMSIGDNIEFEGRLQGFHLDKGMNLIIDSIRIE